MKKQVVLALAILMFAGIFSGCKKGAEDPFFSLLSRKARLTGVWNLSDANYVEKGKSYTETYSFDDGTGIMTYSYKTGIIDFDDNYTYSRVLTINKDNSFVDIETITNDGVRVTTTEGYWFFAPKNDDLDLKNKERVVFQITKITVDNDGDVSFDEYNGATNSTTNIIDLTKLSNKQITINLDYTRTDEDGLRYSISGSQIFIQE